MVRVATLVLACSVVGWALPSQAIIYEYFDEFVDSKAIEGSYDTSMFVSGFIELADPLPSNNQGPIDEVRAFSFSDGRQTMTHKTASFSFFAFFTDEVGDIDSWIVGLAMMETGGAVVSEIGSSFFSSDGASDSGFIASTEAQDVAVVNDRPGTWTLVPEPIVPGLLALSLLGILRRRER